ncbi:MAG: hypothetical protein Q7U60_00965 [Candidatus Methanoperedens sp.]|nr:hypothetical protein [Candidatus Methanoperedens sp.]
MKKYTQEDREAAIKEIKETPIDAKEWNNHETKIKSFRYVDDIPAGKKKGLLSGLLERVKAVLHPA